MVTSHPTQLQLELGHAGEPVSAAVSEHSRACPQCSQYVQTLEREREQLLAREPPGQFASRLQRAALRPRAERGWTPREPRLGLRSSIALAGTLAGTVAVAAIVAGGAAPWKRASPADAGRTAPAAAPVSNPTAPPGDDGAARDKVAEDVVAEDVVAEDVSAPPPAEGNDPRQLSTQAGHHLLAIDPSQRRYRVHLPERVTERMHTGEKISPLLDICVTTQGSVSSVKIVTGSIAAVDEQIPAVISRWKYRPYLVDGKPEPFCYLMRYSIQAR
jgi:hypothetical protein